MRIDDVKVGGLYLTRISGELVPVFVRAIVEIESRPWSNPGRTRRMCVVVRKDNGKVLPKRRAAASLRLTRGQALAESLSKAFAALAALAAA